MATIRSFKAFRPRPDNSNLDRIYTEIGRYYYNLNKEEAPEEIKHLFDSAAKGLENIADKKIKNSKKGIKTCLEL